MRLFPIVLGHCSSKKDEDLFQADSGVCVQAAKHLTDIRPCGPKTDAIRGATFDLLDGRHFEEFQWLPPESYAYLSDDQRRDVQAKVASIV